MPREELVAHLALHGWVPVEGTHIALQRGCERVHIIALAKGISAAYYVHPHELPRVEHDWDRVSTAHLYLMADRIARAELEQCNDD